MRLLSHLNLRQRLLFHRKFDEYIKAFEKHNFVADYLESGPRSAMIADVFYERQSYHPYRLVMYGIIDIEISQNGIGFITLY